MNIHYSTIYLQHEYALHFFEEAIHPDIEELKRRDSFFESLQQEYSIRVEGTDLIFTIPDINISMLLQNKYVSIDSVGFDSMFIKSSYINESYDTTAILYAAA